MGRVLVASGRRGCHGRRVEGCGLLATQASTQATVDGALLRSGAPQAADRQEDTCARLGLRCGAQLAVSRSDLADSATEVSKAQAQDGTAHAEATRQDHEAPSQAESIRVEQTCNEVHCDRSECMGSRSGLPVSRSAVQHAETASAVRSTSGLQSVQHVARARDA
jgi:hypothetical protein